MGNAKESTVVNYFLTVITIIFVIILFLDDLPSNIEVIDVIDKDRVVISYNGNFIDLYKINDRWVNVKTGEYLGYHHETRVSNLLEISKWKASNGEINGKP